MHRVLLHEALNEGGYELQADIYGDIISAVLHMKLPPNLTLDNYLKIELEAAAWCLVGASLANKIILKPELKSALITEIKNHLHWDWDDLHMERTATEGDSANET